MLIMLLCYNNTIASEFVSMWHYLCKDLNIFYRHSSNNGFGRVCKVTVLTFQFKNNRFIMKSHNLKIKTSVSLDFLAVYRHQMVQEEYFCH